MDEYFQLIDSTLDMMSGINVQSRFNGSHKPFYHAFKIACVQEGSVEAINGGLCMTQPLDHRKIIGDIEIRLGDYVGGGYAHDSINLLRPLESKATKVQIWKLLNPVFWSAVDDYQKRTAILNGERNKKKLKDSMVYFSREDPAFHIEPEMPAHFDHDNLSALAAEATSRLYSKDILSANIEIIGMNRFTYFGNSEGTRLKLAQPFYGMILSLQNIDDEGRILSYLSTWYGKDSSALPSLEEILATGQSATKNLIETANAPIQEKVRCPCLFDEENTGVLIHEAVGHAMEAHRYQIGHCPDDTGEVRTFAGKSKKVAPDFITLYDDPTDKSTIGHYSFDDEGVEAQRVTLIKDGKQVDFLHSRQSAGYFGRRSNGHGRGAINHDPVSRMGVLVLESDNKAPYDELYDRFLHLIRKGKHDYGLIFEDAYGGQSMTESDYHQMITQNIFRVDGAGKKERVRGAIQAGTPFETMAKIYMTSDSLKSSNSRCGAESGWIPVGQVMPWTLFRTLEINTLPEETYDQFPEVILPKP